LGEIKKKKTLCNNSLSYLLEIGSKTMHVLIIRKNGFGLGTKEVVIVETNDSHQDGDVVLKRGVEEMLIHFITTTKKLFKVIITNGDGNGQTNGGPEGITTTYPVPELEHVFGINTETSDLLGVGGEGNEMFGDMAGL
jgi:hypothetical protein